MDIIIIARLPLSTSVNSLYSNTRYGGKRLSDDAVDWIDQASKVMNYTTDKTDGPYKCFYKNTERLADIRSLIGNKSKKKEVLARYKFYRMEVVVTTPDMRRDLDNFQKLLQDFMAQWIGFNDNRVMEIKQKHVIDAQQVSNIQVVIREFDRIMYEPDELINWALQEVYLKDMYEGKAV